MWRRTLLERRRERKVEMGHRKKQKDEVSKEYIFCLVIQEKQ